jgi:hypothetical protein
MLYILNVLVGLLCFVLPEPGVQISAKVARHARRYLSTLAGACASRYDLKVLVVRKTGASQTSHMDTRHKNLLVHPFLTVPP